jgi:ABC-type multidrug transport system fused ATPase/permease subunit
MDEATSSLDASTESLISQSTQSLRGLATLLVIAYRLSTVQHADFVFYMGKGTFIGGGTFAELRADQAKFEAQAQLIGL